MSTAFLTAFELASETPSRPPEIATEHAIQRDQDQTVVQANDDSSSPKQPEKGLEGDKVVFANGIEEEANPNEKEHETTASVKQDIGGIKLEHEEKRNSAESEEVSESDNMQAIGIKEISEVNCQVSSTLFS